MERYGIAFNNDDLQAMVLQIQTGKASLVNRESNRLTIWNVKHEDIEFQVVYDSSRGSIVTFLPQ